MLELALGVAVCVTMAKLAAADDYSAVAWFLVTLALCVLSIMVPLPFLRFVLAGIASFLALVAWKAWRER